MAGADGGRTIRVRRCGGDPHRAVLALGHWRLPAVIGRSGITRRKREGDGATPAATLRPLHVLYRADRIGRPRTRLPVAAIRRGDGWCDDPGHRDYNSPIRLPHPGRHEVMYRKDRLYDVVVVLDWNMAPARAGLGSAIFLHLAPEMGGPTAGCIAVTPAVMRRLLGLIDHDTRIVVA